MQTDRLQKLSSIIAMLLLVFVSGGCGEDDGARPISEGSPSETPTYTEDVQPLLQANCSCHHQGGPKYADVPLDTYQRVFARRELIKQRAGVEGSMPPTGPLDEDTRQLIITWVDEGAPE